MKKRILSIFLAALMITTSFANMSVLANDEVVAASASIDFDDAQFTSPAAEWKTYTDKAETVYYIGNGDTYKGSLAENVWMIKSTETLSDDDKSTTGANALFKVATNFEKGVKNEGVDGWFGFGADFKLANYRTAGGKDHGNKGSDMTEMTVVADPADSSNYVLNMMPARTYSNSNSIVGVTGSKVLAKYDLFGKQVDDAVKGNVSLFETKVKLTENEGTGFRMHIIASPTLNMDAIKDISTVAYVDARTYNNLNGANSMLAEVYDAVTFKNGNIYVGNSLTEACGTYVNDAWYTVKYYLDMTGDTPENTVVIYNSIGEQILHETSDIAITDNNKYSEVNCFNNNVLVKTDNAFSFAADNKYAFAVSATASESGAYSQIFVDDVKYEINPTIEIASNSNEFSNDFESYSVYDESLEGTYTIGKRKGSAATTAQYDVYFPTYGDDEGHITNVSWSTGILAQGKYPYNYTDSSDLYLEEGTGYQYPNNAEANYNAGLSNNTYTYINHDNLVQGGIEGYIGFESAGRAKYQAVNDNGDVVDTQYMESMSVINADNGGKWLYMRSDVAGGPAYKIYGTGATLNASYFGKSANIANRQTATKFDVRIKDIGDAGFRFHLVQDVDWETLKAYGNNAAKGKAYTFGANAKGNWYDAITFEGGKVYLGDINDSSNYVCDYTTSDYMSIEYYLDTTDMANPVNTLVVYKNGALAAIKTAPVASGYSTLGLNVAAANVPAATTALATANSSYHTPWKNKGVVTLSDASDYAVVFSNGYGRAYLDNLSFGEGTLEGKVGLAGNVAVATDDESVSTTTVTAIANNTTSAPVTGNVIVAIYDIDSGLLEKVDYTTVTVPANQCATKPFTFSNFAYDEATQEVYCYFWTNFTEINPIADKELIY